MDDARPLPVMLSRPGPDTDTVHPSVGDTGAGDGGATLGDDVGEGGAEAPPA
ncbi:MAG TPA: hypothetical protein VFE39_02465 [Pseudonocardia sp.]|nr:hypothetical protein [Pseudonocardia sp.]